MKAHAHPADRNQLPRFEEFLEAATAAIFRRCPTLCGFAVLESANLSDGLFISEISIYPQRDLAPSEDIRYEIVSALSVLIDECPEASELLRDRTFARVLH
jgi:hypothetical protein